MEIATDGTAKKDIIEYIDSLLNSSEIA